MSQHELTPVQQLHFAAQVLREHGHNGDAYSVEQIAASVCQHGVVAKQLADEKVISMRLHNALQKIGEHLKLPIGCDLTTDILLALQKPIDMILHCPACLEQHIDESDDPSTFPGDENLPAWTNPPHRSHLCKHCGFIWRPADVATNGVAEIKTKGKDDMVLIDGPLEVMRQIRMRDAAKQTLDWDGERP